jgi:hypothetical protein
MPYGPTPSQKTGSNSGDRLVSFRLSDAERIADVVREVEGARRGRKSSSLPRAAGGAASSIVTASFVGGWLKGTEKVIYTVGIPGQASAVTAVSSNVLGNVLHSSSVRKCVLARIDGEYTLLSAEC